MKPKLEPSYHRITWTLRLKIEALFNAGHSRRFIARELGYAPSGIGREIDRGLYDHLDGETWKTIKRYSADIAQQDANSQATAKGPDIKLGKNYAYANHVAVEIKKGVSPDAIVNTLKGNDQWTVSTATLYRYIENGYIPGISSKNLIEKPTRKPSNKDKEQKKATRPPKGASIEQRPREVSTRQSFGHWEQGGVIGKVKGKQEFGLDNFQSPSCA